MVESEFSYVHYLLSKQRNTLRMGDLWLQLTNQQADIYDQDQENIPKCVNSINNSCQKFIQVHIGLKSKQNKNIQTVDYSELNL